ncbi:6-bladed beta-propeller [Anseongella ginsenosidimutans]|uniref:6-bladed beta-propeller n=1 Tax=Anseongella ginsenosidimutans TaxID=496056 RepID=UPI001315A83D|nr:6-bladed beta-propeller [Anseongella ginsenosidimutans]
MDKYERSVIDSAYFEAYRPIYLETREESLIRRAETIRLDDSLLFIFDKGLKKLVIFNTDGKYLNHIQRIGRGPNEYLQLTSFFLDRINKQILLLCDKPYKIQIYDYSGKFVKEIHTKKLYLEAVRDGNYYYCRNFEAFNNEPNPFHLEVLDAEGNIIERHLPINPDYTSINKFLSHRGQLLNKNSSLFFTKRFDNRIYSIRENEISVKYAIDFGPHTIPDNLFNAHSPEDAVDEIQAQYYVYSIYDVIDTEQLLLFQTNLGIFLYDKQKQELQGFKSITNDRFNFTLSNYLPVDANKIAFIEYAATIKTHERLLKKRSSQKLPLYDLSSKIKASDNPVLFIYEVKPPGAF